MNFCHGKGNQSTDGCCWVNGAICPLRWKIVDDHIFDHLGNDLGLRQTYINSIIPNKPGRDAAMAQTQGVIILCRAAIEVLIQDPSRLNDRPAFEAAWNAHPEYVSLVRPAWEALEQSLGLAQGSYQCSSWTGVGVTGAQCCYAEDEATNIAQRATLSTTSVTIRSQRAV